TPAQHGILLQPEVGRNRETTPGSAAGRPATPPPASLVPTPDTSRSATTPERSTPSATTLASLFTRLARLQGDLQLNIWFPAQASLGNTEIAQGAAIAQGIALRSGNTPVVVSHRPRILPGHFNVIVGTVDQLHGFLSPAETASVKNSYLLLRNIPHQPGTELLIITGRDPANINNAILTLGIARETLPAVPSAAIRNVILPTAPPFLRREPLKAERTYTFSELQEAGVGLAMTPRATLRIEFSLPGDTAPDRPGDLVLDLHLGHHGTQQILLERVVATVNEQKGEALVTAQASAMPGGQHHAALRLPLKLFTQGRNLVELSFLGGIGSQPVTDRLEVYSDSTLTLPDYAEPPTLPDLRITARTGYPLIGQPDGSEIAVLLLEPAVEIVESAWTLMARLAQVSNTLLYAAQYSTTPLETSDRHLIVVGTLPNLPEPWQAAIPPTIFEDPLEPVVRQEGTNLKQFIDTLRASAKAAVNPRAPQVAEPAPLTRTWKKQERGYLACEPPVPGEHGWLLLLSAPDAPLLKQRTQELIHPAFWDRVEGKQVYWNEEAESLLAYAPPRYETLSTIVSGQSDTVVSMPLGEQYHFRHWVTAVAITLLVFTGSTYLTLSRLRPGR
ncbi:MAG TPA: cellulose biosynthesis cyclic di-GMP-binding regulatory protein BcsB, partial [Chthoniobacteraceae bacterium]|nr:cellulose biosynthesis cyclic di-GMP-binding regulatory protein BcsB [Chthoniobacteraceae bacterium]